MECIGHLKIIFAAGNTDAGKCRRFFNLLATGGIGKGNGVIFIQIAGHVGSIRIKTA